MSRKKAVLQLIVDLWCVGSLPDPRDCRLLVVLRQAGGVFWLAKCGVDLCLPRCPPVVSGSSNRFLRGFRAELPGTDRIELAPIPFLQPSLRFHPLHPFDRGHNLPFQVHSRMVDCVYRNQTRFARG
jgi:hypothetical protein